MSRESDATSGGFATPEQGAKIQPLVSVVIPTRNRVNKLSACVKSVLGSTYPRFEIVVVDDNSQEDVSVSSFLKHPLIRTYRNERRKYLSGSRNLGARMSRGDYVLFLDDDNVLDRRAVSELVEEMRPSRRIAVASPVALYYSEPTRVWTYSIRGLAPAIFQNTRGRMRGQETVAFHNAFMIRKDVFDWIGGFDEDLRVGFTEIDLAERLRRVGFRLVVADKAFTWHDGSESSLLSSKKPKPETLYLSFRNRILIARKYNDFASRVALFSVSIPLLFLFYVGFTARATPERLRASLGAVVRGIRDGLMTDLLRSPPNRKPIWQAANPLVSVAIPSRNSAGTIDSCLDSIESQTYRPLEVIVVDNRSSDGTEIKVSMRSGVKLMRGGNERSAQLNKAIRAAHGKYVYRVDSDFVVSRQVIEEAVFACEAWGYDAVLVHNTSDPTISLWARVRALERDCYVDDRINVAARFVAKEWLDKVGGFNEALVASEDYDLHNRLLQKGASLGRIRSGEVHIGEPRTLREVVVKHLFYGNLLHGFVSQYQRFSLKQLGPARAAYLRHWRYFLRDPVATFLFPLYEYVRYASAVLGYLSS